MALVSSGVEVRGKDWGDLVQNWLKTHQMAWRCDGVTRLASQFFNPIQDDLNLFSSFWL